MDFSIPIDLVSLWQLSAPALMAETPRAVLWRVGLPDGHSAVLKVARPGMADEEANAGAILRYWQGRGAVTVLAESPGALLLEYLSGPSAGDLARAGEDELAFDVLLSVVAKLHAAAGSPPPGLYPLAFWCRNVLVRPRVTGLTASLIERVARLTEHLLKTPASSCVLHGDLHHDNVLDGPNGWCAIDPKGLWGDPAFDLANCFRNPKGLGAKLHDPARATRMAVRAEATLGYDRKRLLGWAAVQCGLSICWDCEQGAPQADDLALLPMLLELVQE